VEGDQTASLSHHARVRRALIWSAYAIFISAVLLHQKFAPFSYLRIVAVCTILATGLLIFRLWVPRSIFYLGLTSTVLILILIILARISLDQAFNESQEVVVCTTKDNGKYREFLPCFSFSPWDWFPSWLPWEWFKFHRLPCRVNLEYLLCIDKYSAWELGAVIQTALIAIFLFWESREDRGFRSLALCLGIVFGATGFCFYMTLTRSWHWQLLSTVIFLFFLSLADLISLLMEKSYGSQDREKLLFNTFLYADLPVFLSNCVLVILLIEYDTPGNHIFFGGATAFGLVVANLLIFIFRAWEFRVVSRTFDRCATWLSTFLAPRQPEGQARNH
jgi:hypothetical protein